MDSLFDFIVGIGFVGAVAFGAIVLIVKKLIYLCDPNEVLIFSGSRASGRDGMTIGYRIIKGGRAIRHPLHEKVDRMDPTVLSASTVLRMATSGGATAVGLGDKVGSIEVGKQADIIQVAFDDVHHVPTYDVISHLVYVSDEQDVASVVVDGKVLMKEREMLTIDTARVREEANELAARIQAALEARNR